MNTTYWRQGEKVKKLAVREELFFCMSFRKDIESDIEIIG